MRRNQRLSQAQAAISGGDFSLGEDVKSCLLEAPLQAGKQVDIVERSTAQADAIKGSVCSDQLGQFHKSFD